MDMLTLAEMDEVCRWRQELFAIDSLRKYPITRADVVFVFEVGERAWRTTEHPRAAS